MTQEMQTEAQTTHMDKKGWEVGGSLKREGTHVHLWLTHADVQQRSIQHHKTIFLQL